MPPFAPKDGAESEPREKLVLFLIGHGSFTAGESHFLIITQSDDQSLGEGEEVSITKDELQAALKPCQGDISSSAMRVIIVT